MSDERPWQDEETLRELYVDKDLSAAEVATRLGCAKSTVCKWLNRHGFETPEGGKPTEIEELTDESAMREMYEDMQLNSPAIADRLGTSTRTVCHYLRVHGIEVQGGGWRTATELRDKEVLRRMYVDENMTTIEIGDVLECGASTVGVWLHHHSIPTRPSHALPGPDHPLHTAGSPLRRQVTRALSPRWGGQRKKQRERDDNTCRNCGEKTTPDDDKHAVHHIVPTLYGGGNGDWNLMTLCASCHKSADHFTKRHIDPVIEDWSDDELPEGRGRWRPPEPTAEQATFEEFAADD